MSLNEQATDDLPKDTLVDENIIKSSPITQPNNDSTVIIPVTKEIKATATVIPQDELQQIINSDISFKTVQDGVVKITELEDIEKEFIATESIDQKSAQYLSEYFPNLLTVVSLEEFTKSPTKTNYFTVSKHIKSAIALEQEEVQSNFITFMRQSLKDVSKVLEHIKEDYLQTFLSDMRNMAKLAETVVVDISTNKNTIVPYANGEHVEFIDVAELDLLKLDFGNLRLNDDSVTTLTAYKTTIEAIIINSDIKTVIVLANDAQAIQFPVTKEFMIHVNEANINLLYLAKFFNSNHLKDYIETFSGKIDELLIKADELEATLMKQYNYQEMKDFLVKHSEDINCLVNKALTISSHISNISALGLNVQEMFIYLSKIAHPKA